MVVVHTYIHRYMLMRHCECCTIVAEAKDVIFFSFFGFCFCNFYFFIFMGYAGVCTIVEGKERPSDDRPVACSSRRVKSDFFCYCSSLLVSLDL